MYKQASDSQPFNPFRLNDLLFKSCPSAVKRPLVALSERLLGLTPLASGYESLPRGLSSLAFANVAMNYLNVKTQVVSGDIRSIPTEGATVVVANHPFGGIEGVILARMLQQIRPDVRIMANSMLERIPELSETFIGVNPYGHSRATRENIKPVREALRWLQGGGLLVVFPAGDVSRWRPLEGAVRDERWDASIVRLIRRTGANVVPLFFEGRNSALFHGLGLLHPIFRSMMLARELANKRGQLIPMHVGKLIDNRKLQSITGDDEAARYLRLRTYLLSKTHAEESKQEPEREATGLDGEPMADAVEPALMAREVAELPAGQLLNESGSLGVYYAHAEQIPWTLQEIGRLREITFRTVGEGSGKSSDIDLYDSYYLHLFIWNREKQEVVGAYRLGLADEIYKKYGKKGLYSYSLFRYSKRLLKAINPAIELGRSFVRSEYQRSFTPLLLLWKGIGQFVVNHPRYTVLFGPVSISNDYSSSSQQLLIDFLKANNYDEQLSRMIRPRSPYRGEFKPVWKKTDLAGLGSIDNVSELVAMQEADDKGVPILIKQYLKLGGRLLGFNVDRDFNDCIDGLIMVDLTHTEPKVLQKYMGKEGALQFLSGNSEVSVSAGSN
jgi:putative hemolysin